MGRNTTRTMAIVRAEGRATAITEGSREFCSVLETVSADGRVLPPFIVWQGKTHRESYYKAEGLDHPHDPQFQPTFTVSESGYMDNELGFEYMKTHFEPHTRKGDSGSVPRCLIVDGHSSHLEWKMVRYALDHDIHLICLPSKSTHLLQPLDVGCFGVLQRTYEKNLSAWLRMNPLSAISKPAFLDILYKTRNEVYTIDCIVGAWKKSRCWPINRVFTIPSVTASNSATSTIIPPAVSDNVRAMDTPAHLRALSRVAEDVIRLKLNPDEKSSIYQLIDFAGEKITQHRDIAPRAETLKKLRSGKTRKEKTRSRHIGEARVLTYKHVNEGLHKLEEDDDKRVKRQQIIDAKKKVAEDRKIMRDTIDKQYKADLQHHLTILVPQWQAACKKVDADWAAAKQLAGRAAKKPEYPPRPKRPRKVKIEPDVSALMQDTINEGLEDHEEVEEGLDTGATKGHKHMAGNDVELVNSMQALGITHFSEVSHLNSTLAFTIPSIRSVRYSSNIYIDA